MDGHDERLEWKEEASEIQAVRGLDAVEDCIPLEGEAVGEADDLQELISENEEPEASPMTEEKTFAEMEEPVEDDEQAIVVTGIEDNNLNSDKIDSEEGANEGITEERTVASVFDKIEPRGLKVGDVIGDSDGSGCGNDLNDSEDEDEIHPSPCMSFPMTERKRNKELQIFVGGLSKETVEEDLVNVFGEFGEIQSARIVKHPVTQKSKGFAFIQYATAGEANKALAELKDGIEIRGKLVGISASVDNDTLYLGNICKTWTKDQVLDTLKNFIVEPVEEILLPNDSKKEGNNRGFAFVEFGSHSEAMTAFQRLRKPDVIFGCDRSVKVAFAQFSINPSEEAMSQVKSVYVEGIPPTWNEEKIKEICKQYGEVENIRLSRNFSKSKRKDLCFIAFASHKSAVLCIQGISDAELGEENLKIKASLTKPKRKGWLAKRGVRGGFKVKMNDEVSEEFGQSQKKNKRKIKKNQGKKIEEKEKVFSNSKDTKEKKAQRSKGKIITGKSNDLEHQKNVEPSKGRKRRRNHIAHSALPSKKPRKNFHFHGRHSASFGSQRNAHYGMVRATDMMHPIPYSSGYIEPTTSHQLSSYTGASGPNYQRSDLAPHAGYLPASQQGHNPFRHMKISLDAYENQQRIGSGLYQSQQRIGASGYDSQLKIYSGGYNVQPRTIVSGYRNPQRTSTGYPVGSEAESSYTGYSVHSSYEASYPYSSRSYPSQGPYY